MRPGGPGVFTAPVIDPNAKLWEQREGETGRAFAAFVAYRDMGVERSLAKVGQMLDKSVNALWEWSSKYEWVVRVVAWDAEQYRLRQEENAAARKAVVDRHNSVAGGILAQVARHLTPPEFQADGKTPLTDEEKRKWKARPEVVRMATHALKETSVVQRLALGLPTVISKTQVETEQAVKEALEAQRLVEAIIRELMDNDCDCEPCRATQERLTQLAAHRQRAADLIAGGTA